jgi:NAD binding domain of 6-phosphogluconate dehydrogenase
VRAPVQYTVAARSRACVQLQEPSHRTSCPAGSRASDQTDAALRSTSCCARAQAVDIRQRVPCRQVIILVKAGKPVDATIQGLSEFMEEGDTIIDGGNEWRAPAHRPLALSSAEQRPSSTVPVRHGCHHVLCV